MLGYTGFKHVLIIVVVVFNLCATGVSSAKKDTPPKKAKKRVTVTIVNRRLVVVEKKLQELTDQLTNTKQELQQLQQTVAAAKPQGSHTAAGSPRPERFEDLTPCPNIQEFFYSEELRSCYHLEPNSVLQNFTDATATCSELHPKAHLVVVGSPAEQRFLQRMWYHERGIASISRFWINLKKVENRSQWKWATSGKRLMYSNWIPTTTHDDERYQCAAIYSNEGYFWGDVACWGPHMVTCEVDM